MAYHYILALALITGTEDVKFDYYDDFSIFYIQSAAIQLELLDPRETGYICNIASTAVNRENYFNDLKILRGRWENYKNSPRLWEINRFPPLEVANSVCQFNRQYANYVSQQVYSYKVDLANEVMRETNLLFHPWDRLREARCEYYYITVRRNALKDLKDALGDQMFYNGQMPPFVPLWRFTPIIKD